jgi:uncharacterized protein (TIGR00251 family)
VSSELLIEVRVRPNSSHKKVGGAAGDSPRLLVFVQAPAVDGKANTAALKELAKSFHLRVRDFSIVFGELSRDKRILVRGNKEENESMFENLKNDLRLF